MKYSYPFKGIISSLERLLIRPGMCESLEKWRQRKIPEGCLADVYDGALWKEHSEFFARSKALALTINLDIGFSLSSTPTDSVGALHAVIINLPRHPWFKKENVLLGILPVLKAEPKHVNAFIQPLVDERMKVKEGVWMYTSDSLRFKVTVKAILLCAANDIPATRKLCGFKSHSANYGCSRCLKLFPGSVGSKDNSGFDRQNQQYNKPIVYSKGTN